MSPGRVAKQCLDETSSPGQAAQRRHKQIWRHPTGAVSKKENQTTMKSVQTIRIAAALVGVLAMNAWSAEGENEWSRVVALPTGARVEVIHSGLKRSQGELVRVSDSEIAVRSDAGSTTITRAEVRRVTVNSRSRKRRALIGLAIGAGVGALVTVGAARSGDIDIRRDYVAGAGAVVGAGAGAAIGAATGGPVTVYRSSQTGPTH